MNGLRSTVLVVGAALLVMSFVNMAAEAVTGEPVFSTGNSNRTDNAEKTSSSPWVLPVDGEVSTKYNVQGSSWASGRHTGVDFPVSSGTEVKAVGPGRVVKEGNAGAYGIQVVIKHAPNIYTQYAHLSSVNVGSGDKVNAGEVIGRAGSTGNSSGPHLHFGVRKSPNYGDDIDPVSFLKEQGAMK